MTTSNTSTPERTGLLTLHLWPEKKKASEGKPTEKVNTVEKNNDVHLTDITSPSITLYPLQGEDKKPAVLVSPGGGYGILSYIKEGIEIAEWLNSIGIIAIVLKYTVPKDRDSAFNDIQRAMGIIRNNAESWNIDPDKLGVIGFSAGAHLSARLSNNFDKRTYTQIDEADSRSCKPDFTILIYPAYLETLSVSKGSPETFILQTKDDRPFIEGTKNYIERLEEKDIPLENHLFEKGGHGYGMRETGYPVSTWPGLCKKWLKNIKINN